MDIPAPVSRKMFTEYSVAVLGNDPLSFLLYGSNMSRLDETFTDKWVSDLT